MSDFPFQRVKFIQSAFGFISSSLDEKLAFEKKTYQDLGRAHQTTFRGGLSQQSHQITRNFRKSNFAFNLY